MRNAKKAKVQLLGLHVGGGPETSCRLPICNWSGLKYIASYSAIF